MVWAFGFFVLLDTKSTTGILLAIAVGLLCHAAMYGPQAAELFDTGVRYSGASVGYQLASVSPAASRHRGRRTVAGDNPGGGTLVPGRRGVAVAVNEHEREPDNGGSAPEAAPGGDPVCWLSRVCPECGLFIDGELPKVCGRCGACVPADDAVT